MVRPRRSLEVVDVTDGYRQIDSFESAPPSAVGTGPETIAFGMDDRITLVSGNERITIDHGEPIVDIAVGDRLLVLSAATLTAYSLDGDRVWTHDATEAYAVELNASCECCGVLDADYLRYVDVASGRERLAVERSRSGTPDDGFVATPTGFVIGTWSFLTGIDSNGEVAFDRDLSAVVRSVAAADGIVIAALQSEQLVGLSATNGEDQWRTELDARQVTPAGGGETFVSTGEGVLVVGDDGTTEPVPDLPNCDVYATTDGSIVCSVRDGTIATHVPDVGRVDVEVPTGSVGVGGTVNVRLSNPTDTEQTVETALAVDGCELSPAERTVTIGAEEAVVVDFPVAEVRREGLADTTVMVDGEPAVRESIEVEDAASGGLAVETTLSPTRIDDGVAEIGVTVENVGGVPLDSIRLLEAGTEATDVAPGDVWEGTVTRPYEPERPVSVGLEVARGDRRREYAPMCSLPPMPTIDAVIERDALRATVAVDGDVPVTDQLVVEMPGAGRVRLPVTIEGEELLLVVPQYESGVARIALAAVETEERVRIPGTGSFTGTAASSTQSSGSSQPTIRGDSTDTNRSSGGNGSIESNQPEDARSADTTSVADAGRSGNDETNDLNVDTRANPSATQPSDPGSSRTANENVDQGGKADTARTGDASSGEAGGASTDKPSDTSTARSDGADVNNTETSLSVTRQAPATTPGVGHAIRDQILVENNGDPVDVALDDGDRVELGRVGRDETVSVERFAAASDVNGLTLPAVTVEADENVVDKVDAKSVVVTDEALDVSTIVDPANGAVTAVFKNDGDEPRRVTGIEPGPDGGRGELSTTVSAGGTATVETAVLEPPAPGDVVPLSFWVESPDGDTRRSDVLAAVDATSGQGDASHLDVAISPDTQVAGEYSSVVLSVENVGDTPLKDVSVAADGDPIDEMFYSPARREVVEPASRIEHFVDLESGLTKPAFEVTVTYEAEGTAHEYVVEASGPAVDDEEAWTEDHLAAWGLTEVETDVAPEPPSRLTTTLELSE